MLRSLSCVARSSGGDDAEAAGPGDLLAGREGDLEETDGLALAGPRQTSSIGDLEATGGENAGQQALGGYRLFTRPSVAVAPGALRITNPTRQWRVPLDLITGTDDNLTYVRVHAGDRRIVCAGLEKSNLSLLRGDTTIDERIDRAMVKAQSDDHGDEKVTWRWTRPDVPEVVLLCSWGVYFAIGAFVSHR